MLIRTYCDDCNDLKHSTNCLHAGTYQVIIVNGSDKLEKVEEQLMLLALDYCKDNRTHAATSLGISTRTLQRKLKRMGVQ